MNNCLNCNKLVKNKYCNVSCQNQHQNSKKANKKYGYIIEFEMTCGRCNKKFKVLEREKLHPQKSLYFCSRGCANHRIHSEETKLKISKSLTNKNPTLSRNCPICHTTLNYKSNTYRKRADKKNQTCKKCKTQKEKQSNHFSKMGLKSVKKQNKRSKNEIYFAELCKNKFNTVLTNEQIFNGWDADVILPEYKIAVLWNGIWHYKEIRKNNSLTQIQNRDKIKLHEIKSCGYIPYIIQDMGKYNKKFVETKFNDMVAEIGVQPIIALGRDRTYEDL